jgi:putative peptidoglycan lipid II flippase
MVGFSDTIIKVIFQRVSFTAGDSNTVSSVQAIYAFQIPFYIASIFVVRLMSSLRANYVLMWKAGINLIVNVGLNILFIHANLT